MSSHSGQLINAHISSVENWECWQRPGRAGLHDWIFWPLMSSYSIYWDVEWLLCLSPCAISTTVTHVLIFLSTDVVLMEGEKKTFLRVGLKCLDNCVPWWHEIVFYFLTVRPPVYWGLIGDKSTREACAIWRGRTPLIEKKKKGNVVSKTNISVTEDTCISTQKADEFYSVLGDKVEQEQITCSKHFWKDRKSVV